MYIDELAGVLVGEEQDLATISSYFDSDRVLPEYLELAVLERIFAQLQLPLPFSVEEALAALPREFVTAAVSQLNTMFTGESASYEHHHLSYLLYYFPVNVFKVWKPLFDLQLGHTLKPNLKVLDVGSGPGSVPLGLVEYFKALAESFPQISFSLSFTLLEAEQTFLEIAGALLETSKRVAPANLKIELAGLHRIELATALPNLPEYDLITFSNFFTTNEGNNRTNALPLLQDAKRHLAPDGSIIIIEPGQSKQCHSLKRLRNEVVNNNLFQVYAPCLGLWEEKTSYDCSCFGMVRSYWQLPSSFTFLAANGLAKAAREDIPFNYLILRQDRKKKYRPQRNSQHYVRLAEVRNYEGQRINVKGILRTVIEKQDSLALSLCDGSCSFAHDGEAIWVNVTQAKLRAHGVAARLIAAEKITLKGVTVACRGKQVELILDDKTSLDLAY